jgi:maleylacetoacetate isomerase/maleylpyruvate isomerase
MNLKGLKYDCVPVDLVSGEHHSDIYAALNPGKAVPTLVMEDGATFTQSLAIIDYLDTVSPHPPMLPSAPLLRSRVLEVALTVATDIHPVNNQRVLERLSDQFGAADTARTAWMRHWMAKGFAQLAALLPPGKGFAFGGAMPDLADVCITTQSYNAHRWGVDLGRWPRLAEIEEACLELPAFAAAHPDNQTDAQPVPAP